MFFFIIILKYLIQHEKKKFDCIFSDMASQMSYQLDVWKLYVCLWLHSALGLIVQVAVSMENFTLICVCFKCTNDNEYLSISGFWSVPYILPCVVIGPFCTLPVAAIARPEFILRTHTQSSGASTFNSLLAFCDSFQPPNWEQNGRSMGKKKLETF